MSSKEGWVLGGVVAGPEAVRLGVGGLVAVSVPKNTSALVRRHVGTRGVFRRVGLVGVFRGG